MIKSTHRFLPIIFILALALFIRLPGLSQSFWLDEAINVQAARDLPLGDLLLNYSLGDFHPPLYHFLLRGWLKLVGVSEVAARLPSVVFSLVTVWLTYLIGLKLFPDKGKLFPLLAPLLLATSGLSIFYAQESRMYSLAACLTTLVFYYFLKLRQKQTLSGKLIFTAFLTLLMLTDYQPWLLLPLFFIGFPFLSALSLGLTAPWWPYLVRQLANGLAVASAYPAWQAVVGALSLKSFLLLPVKFLVGRVSLPDDFQFALVILAPAMVVGYLFFRAFRDKDRLFYPVKLWLTVPVIAGLVISLKIPLFSYFRFLFLLPAFYLVLVRGLVKLKPGFALVGFGILLATNLVSSLAYLTNPAFQREDWRALAAYTGTWDPAGSLVVFPNLAQSAAFAYYNRAGLPLADYQNLDLEDKPETVIFVRYVAEIFDPEGKIPQNLLDSGYRKEKELTYPGLNAWEYRKN